MKLGELKVKPPKILLMGTFGTAKTVTAASLGELAIMINMDDNLTSAKTFKDQFHDARQKMEVLDCVDDDPTAPYAFDKARNYIKSLHKEAKEGKMKQKVMIVDGYTNLADAAVRKVLKESGKLGQMPSQPNWGQAFLLIEEVLLDIKTMKVPVILIAHLRRVEDSDASHYEIGTPGQKLPQKIPTYFSEVWAMKAVGTTAEPKFVIQTVSDGLFNCRTSAQLKNDTDSIIGMVEIFKQLAYPLV